MEILCAICFDNLFICEKEESIYSTNCGHVFHYSCLLQWIESSNTCPECRQNVSIDGILKLNVHVIFAELSVTSVSENKRITRSSTKSGPQSHIFRSELELKNSQLELKVKELSFPNLKLYRMENIVAEKEIDELRFENDKLQKEINKLKSELQSEKEKNIIIRSDLRIIDIIDLESNSDPGTTRLIDLTL